MNDAAQEEHHWLQALVGDWTCESDCYMGPDRPRGVFSGTEVVRPLGDLWIVAEGRGGMPGGGTMLTRMTLGFDPRAGRFVGTWVGSMMSYLWVYDGALDPSRSRLILSAEGPAFDDPSRTAAYQDVVERDADGTRRLRGRVRQDDGAWFEFLVTTYRRVG